MLAHQQSRQMLKGISRRNRGPIHEEQNKLQLEDANPERPGPEALRHLEDGQARATPAYHGDRE